MRVIILVVVALILHIVSPAQVAVSSGSYFQDFGTTDIFSWTNNITYQGWSMVGTFQSHQDITASSPSNTGGFYTYECNNNNDQKIGSRASGGSGTLRYGVVLQNTTGSTVSHVRVSYKGYQLSLAQNGNTNVIAFDYIVGATAPAIGAAGGTAVAPLNFTQLQSNGSSGSAQVMGYPCTQMANMSNCITVTIPNNSYILLRWTDVDDSGNDHHMAIDDIDVQFLSTNLAVNSATICNGGTATLTATGASNFTWTPSATLSSATGSVVTANPSATTVYTISGSVLSCPVKTITSMVTVNPATPLTVNSATICGGGSATLTASGSTSYSWTPATGLSSTTGSSVIANPGTTTIYTVSGAGGACPVAPATSTVTVLPTPVLTASSQTICSSTSATLSAGGASTYTWSPATNLSAVNGSTVIANPPVTTVYTLNGSNGTCSASPITVTVSVVTSPTVTVNSATICPAGTATLTATGATTYTWGPAGNLSSLNGNSVTANPASTSVYTVSGTIAGCGGGIASSTVTVLSVPVISVNSESICASGTATLTANGAANYTWSPATGLSSATGNPVTANPAVTTVYTINGTSGACPIAPVTATVTVVPNPVLTAASQTICSSTSVLLTANGATSYTWSPAATLSSPNGASVNANPSTTTIYTLNGSTGSCIAAAITLTLTVVNSPTVTVTSASMCASSPVNLTASGAAAYSWSPATGLSSTTGMMVVADPAATTIYTVTGSIGSCTSSATSTVIVIPVQSAAFNYPSANYCLNSSDPAPTITGASGGLFSCTSPGLLIDQVTGIISLASSLPATYTVSYATSGMCNETNSVVVNISPTPSLTVNSATICDGENTTLIAVPSSSGGSFNWLPGNKNNASLLASPSINTTYTVTYLLNGCSANQTAKVVVKPKPSASIMPSSTYVVDGDELTLTASGGDHFLWDNGSFGTTITLRPTEKADYCVTASNDNGCQNTACITVDVTKESTLYVPNTFTPNGDQLNDVFLIPTTNLVEYNIKIFDRWGSLLFESTDVAVSWDGTYKGKAVASDVYVYAITGQGADRISYTKRGHVTVLK
jgi:gliding motility-associated-like protein